MADLMVSLIKYAEATVSQNPVRATEILGEFNVSLRELEAKAARYDWLSKNHDYYNLNCMSPEAIDALIDQSIKDGDGQ